MTNNCFLRPFLFSFLLLTSFFSLAPLPLMAADVAGKPSIEPVAEPLVPANNSADDLRLALEKVELLADTNHVDEAAILLCKLKSKYPGNSEIVAADADLKLRIGNTGAAFVELNKAMVMDPRNEDILTQQRTVAATQGPFALGGINFRQTNESNEFFQRVQEQFSLRPTLSLNLNFENDMIHTRQPLVFTNGMTHSFEGNIQRGSAMLTKVFENGNQANGVLFAGTNNVGGGGGYDWWNHSGVTQFQGNLNRPDWDYVQTVIEQGTQSNFRINRKQFITNDVEASLGATANRYDIRDISDVADSLGWDGSLNYSHPFSFSEDTDQPLTIGANYTVDAEYFTHAAVRTATDGTRYKPLPVSGYEVHSFTGSLSKNVLKQLSVEGYGGYAINRLDDNSGPLYGAALEYTPLSHLGIDVRGFRTLLGGVNNNEKEEQVGVNVKWIW